MRQRAAARLGAWSHAHFRAETEAYNRLIEAGDVRSALAKARALVARCVLAGDDAYLEAAYDTALAHYLVGGALAESRAAGDAIVVLEESRRRFEALPDGAGRHMAVKSLSKHADCLDFLGRVTEAAAAYEECIRQAEALGDAREVAVNRGNLADVRLKQGRTDEALAQYDESRLTFERLRDPKSVSSVWNKLGMAYRLIGRYTDADDAFRRALAIRVREGNLSGQGMTLSELGNLYIRMGRPEEAVACLRQAAEIFVRLDRRANEGTARSNLAVVLMQLDRHDEARRELERAIECKTDFGHAAEPWKTWSLLQDLERSAGRAEAALKARQQAVASYLAYRREGGVSQSPAINVYELVRQAAGEADTHEAEAFLTGIAADPKTPAYLRVVVPKLAAVLDGERDPSLADDPALDYDDAAELRFLLDRLAPGAG